MKQLPKSIMDDILQKDTQLNAQLGQVELENALYAHFRGQDSFSLKLLLHTQAKHTIASMQADKVNMLQQLAQGGMQVSQIQEALLFLSCSY